MAVWHCSHRDWVVPRGVPDRMFLFFSNRLGCLGSLLLSAAVTAILILVLSH